MLGFGALGTGPVGAAGTTSGGGGGGGGGYSVSNPCVSKYIWNVSAAGTSISRGTCTFTPNCCAWVWCPCPNTWFDSWTQCENSPPVSCGAPLTSCENSPLVAADKVGWQLLCGDSTLGPPDVAGRYFGEIRFICRCPTCTCQSYSSPTISYTSHQAATCISNVNGPAYRLPTMTGGFNPYLPLLIGQCFGTYPTFDFTQDIGIYTWCPCPCKRPYYVMPYDQYKCPVAAYHSPVPGLTSPWTGEGHWVFQGGCHLVGPPPGVGDFYGDTRIMGNCSNDSLQPRTPYSYSMRRDSCNSIPRRNISWKYNGYNNNSLSARGTDHCVGIFAQAWVWCPCNMVRSMPPPAELMPCPTSTVAQGGAGGWAMRYGDEQHDVCGPPPVPGRYFGEVAQVWPCTGNTITPVFMMPPRRKSPPRRTQEVKEPIQLLHGCAPGDIVCLTSLPRDIMRAHPDRYEIHVATHCPALWANNPYVKSYQQTPLSGIRAIELDYTAPMLYMDQVKKHFITAFHRNFEDLEYVTVPCTEPKGDLHLSDEEKTQKLVDGRYWVLFAGGKFDMPAKVWSAARWQQVVDQLTAQGIQVVQSGAIGDGFTNPKLENVIDRVGVDGLRATLQLIYHAEGVLTPISFPMHVAAALDKPCVVVAGGREHVWWESYNNFSDQQTFGAQASQVKVPHRFLHTIDKLPCCLGKGCWKSKVQAEDGKSVCQQPVDDGHGQLIPGCLNMITVEQVVEAVLSYYTDGTLMR